MEKVKLKDLGEIFTGNTPSKKNKDFYKSNDICFFKPSDIDEDNIKLLNKSEEYISKLARDKARILPKGTILVTCIGTIGKIGILNVESACNQQINAIIPNKKIDTKYLAYLIQSRKKYLQKKANAPVIPIINKADFSNIELTIYDKPSQIKIANELDKIQEIIELRKKQIEGLDRLIKSQFIEMFVNDNCDKNTLKNISKFQQGTQVPLEDQIEECKDGYNRFLRIIDYTQAPQKPRYVKTKGKLIDERSVVVVRYGATAGFVGRGYSGIIANNLFEIIPDENIISKDFLYIALKYGNFEDEINKKSFGAAMPALSFGMVQKIIVETPPIQQQNKFAEFVKQIDKQKFEIQKSLKEMQKLQGSLMNKYFG